MPHIVTQDTGSKLVHEVGEQAQLHMFMGKIMKDY